MRRLGWPTWVGSCAFLVILAGLLASTAFGATTSWKFETETYDFGPQLPGRTLAEHSFVLTNTGELPITRILWGIRWWGAPPLDPELFKETSSSKCRAIQPEESCSMRVAFNPLTPGLKQGELSASTSSGEPPEIGVQMKGEGGSLYVAIEPESLNLGSVEVGGSASSRVVTVVNQGDVNLVWEGTSLTDLLGDPLSPDPFEIRGESCVTGLLVAPGGYCTIQVALAPSTAGSFKGRLQIAGSPSGSPQSVELSGTVTPARSGSSGPGTSKPQSTRLVCPSGKRRVVKGGKQACVKKDRHRRHRSRKTRS